MVCRAFIVTLVFAVIAMSGIGTAQEKKKRTGTLTGEIQSKKNTPNNKNTIIEVLAPGEEKARPYRVMYDPAVKGPNAKLLAAVRAANVGDQVRFEWVDTGEGLAMTSFQVVRKGGEKKE